MSNENLASRWAKLKRPQSVSTASAALSAAANVLRDTEDAAFPTAFHDFVTWFEPSAKHVGHEFGHAMRYAAAGRSGPLAVVLKRFPAPPAAAKKANGAHPPQQQAKPPKPEKRPRSVRDAMQELGYSANDFGHFEEPEELIKRLLPAAENTVTPALSRPRVRRQKDDNGQPSLF